MSTCLVLGKTQLDMKPGDHAQTPARINSYKREAERESYHFLTSKFGNLTASIFFKSFCCVIKDERTLRFVSLSLN